MNAAELFEKLAISITPVEIGIMLAGLAVFVVWLFRTALGTEALRDSKPRRNSMSPFTPMVPMFLWFFSILFGTTIVKIITPDVPEWQKALFDNIFLCAGSAVTIVIIGFLARGTFAGRLKGFGLNPKTIGKDLCIAPLNLLAVWPLVNLILILTMLARYFIFGSEFEIPKHQELEHLVAHSQLSVRILIIAVSVVFAPVFEEMLFRGLFQTMLRSYLPGPWIAIMAAAGLFALVHGDVSHWPVLFVLGAAMGYAYEKSGSLLRSIFMHALFNGINVTVLLIRTHPDI